MDVQRRRPVLGFLALVAFLAVVYGPDLDAGLSKDDFAWVAHSRISRPLDVLRLLLTAPTGFYRPVVHFTFAANHAMFGLEPLAYSLTNFTLLVTAVAGVALLGRSLSMSAGAAVAAAALWGLSPHGINMATLWISGRTALVLVNLAILTAILFVRRPTAWSAVTCFLALLSKEEALLLPAVLFVWALIDEGPGPTSSRRLAAARRVSPLALATAVYLLLRLASGAFTPATAPDFYRPTLALTTIARNAFEYLDRGATFALFMPALAAVLARTRPRLEEAERRIVLRGAAWFAFGYGLVLFLPVRSSLYACLPSVGAALIGGCLLSAVWRRATEKGRRRATVVALIPVLALPLYWARNVRHVRDARFASRVREALLPDLPAIREGRAVVLHDDPATDLPAQRAFVFAFPEAVRLWSGRPDAVAWIDPPPPGWEARLRPPPPGAPAIHLVVEGPSLHRH